MSKQSAPLPQDNLPTVTEAPTLDLPLEARANNNHDLDLNLDSSSGLSSAAAATLGEPVYSDPLDALEEDDTQIYETLGKPSFKEEHESHSPIDSEEEDDGLARVYDEIEECELDNDTFF